MGNTKVWSIMYDCGQRFFANIEKAFTPQNRLKQTKQMTVKDYIVANF